VSDVCLVDLHLRNIKQRTRRALNTRLF
jgi:hypothetical protein